MHSIFKIRLYKLLPNNLLFRFFLIIILPLLIGQFASIYLFYKRHWYNVSSNHGRVIAVEVSELAKNIDQNTINIDSGTYLNLKYSLTKSLSLPHYYDYNLPEELIIFKKILKEYINNEIRILPGNSKNVELYLNLGDKILKIELPYKSLITPTTHLFVLWIIFLTIFILIISLIFSRNQIKSIIELTNSIEQFGCGGKNVSYKPSGAQEIRQAGKSFLKMKNRIEQYNKKRAQFLAMISHDLKTPLTRMKLQVSMMKKSEEQKELLYDINSMHSMINSYLNFLQGKATQQLAEINVKTFITEYVKAKWQKANIALNISCKNTYIKADKHSLTRAFDNLIANSIRYASLIQISLLTKGDNVIFLIEDNGIGISEKEKKFVFKPFYRADISRSLDNSSSVGLGLAITKEIIENHKGEITLEDSIELKGLMVKIVLPKIIYSKNYE